MGMRIRMCRHARPGPVNSVLNTPILAPTAQTLAIKGWLVRLNKSLHALQAIVLPVLWTISTTTRTSIVSCKPNELVGHKEKVIFHMKP